MWSAATILMTSLVLVTAVKPFWNDGKFKDVICPNGNTCPDGNRCCPDNIHCCAIDYPVCCPDGLHCCPSGFSTCCPDGLHCCPGGYICSGTSCVLSGARPGENNLAAILGKKTAPRKDRNLKDVVCPDGGSCSDGNTCCLSNSGAYGCCPQFNANCCSDGVHCCPSGYICGSTNCFREGKSHPMMELLSSPAHHKVV